MLTSNFGHSSQPCEVVRWQKRNQAINSEAISNSLEYGEFLLSDMEATNEDLRKKHQVTQEDIDEALEQTVGHTFYKKFGEIVTGVAATGKQQRAQDYLKEKKEIEVWHYLGTQS